jgi:hypothetical protein
MALYNKSKILLIEAYARLSRAHYIAEKYAVADEYNNVIEAYNAFKQYMGEK